MEIDIATLLENHRRHMLTVVNEQEYDNEDELAASRFAIASAHDRATTKALLDMYRTANSTQPVGNAAPPTPITTASRKVKAGSKKAKDRALKAGETRRRNLAAKQSQVHSAGNSNNSEVPPMDNVKLAASGEGGAA